MSQWFEVKVVTVQYYAVEVEDDETSEHAEGVVADEVFNWDTITSSAQNDKDLDNLLRNTDKDKIFKL